MEAPARSCYARRRERTMQQVLTLAALMSMLAYPTLLFVALSAVTCGVLTAWPRFRTFGALLRVCVVIAATVGIACAWYNHGPSRATASPAPAATDQPQVAQLPSQSMLTQGSPTTRPLAATVMDIEGRSYLVAELPKATTRRKPTTQRTAIAILGPAYSDETNGFSIRFPSGWQIKTFANANPWVIDASDGRDAIISVGFAPFPKDAKAEHVKLDMMASTIRSEPQTTLHGQGYGAVDGRRAVWAHATGPLPMTDAAPQMTRMHYLVPLQDGRALELRLAARPEKYEQLLDLMKQSANTFKLLPRK